MEVSVFAETLSVLFAADMFSLAVAASCGCVRVLCVCLCKCVWM